MRTAQTVLSIGLAFVLSASLAKADEVFPAGKSGQGGFDMFPRWERVMADTDVSPAPAPDTQLARAPAAPVRQTVRLKKPASMKPVRGIAENAAREQAKNDRKEERDFHLPLPHPAARSPLVPPRNTPARAADGAPQTPDCRDTQSCGPEDWQAVLDRARPLPLEAQLDRLNRWANGIAYKDDLSNWAMADHWQTPAEFLSHGGDCEDYAILKYFGLRELGVPAGDMRITVLYDEKLETHHAVLLVRAGGEVMMLDNQKEHLARLDETPHYRPIYSVNGESWWLHKTLRPVRLTPMKVAGNNTVPDTPPSGTVRLRVR